MTSRWNQQREASKPRPLRHTRRTPCPVCGGGRNDRRKRGMRCCGYTSADGRFAFCTLEEYAGKLPLDPRSQMYRHRLDASCPCEEPHASGSNAAALALGAGEVLYPGQPVTEHARGAIQTLSDGVPEQRVFTHTGWQQMDGEWRYLHAAGAQGAQNAREDVTVQLPSDLMRYQLPCLSASTYDHIHDDAIIGAVRASLGMLEVAPDVVTVPVYAAIWRSALGVADFSLHIAGQTGEGKSELAALAQQHFGAGMDARHLPATWVSTGNALEALAFQAKDALLVVDDFIPTRVSADTARLLRAAKPPRGLILSTGEDTPRGPSLRARMLILEHAPSTLDWQRLSLCQRDAAAGQYALAMAAYLRWCAGRYEALQAPLRPDTVREYIQCDKPSGQTAAPHKRTSDGIGQLWAAMGIFCDFARELGVLSEAETVTLMARSGYALLRVGGQQLTLQRQGEPTARFLALLSAAISSGEAHIATPSGEKPDAAPGVVEALWGWRQQRYGADGGSIHIQWLPQGRRIGWLDGEHLYLDPEAAYAAAQLLGQQSGDPLTVTQRTLWKRLHERHLLVSHDSARETLKIRLTVEGRRINVIHVHVSTITGFSRNENPTNPTNLHGMA